MRKHEAERLVNKLNNGAREWLQEKFNNRAPRFAEWRQGIPKECLTKNFKAFANRLMIAGFELKNAFSIYSKLVLVAPEFVNRYITEGPVIKRPMTGEWNLRELIEAHYGISESVYRIIEQEKCPDKLGTIRSGFEALQAIFIKGCRLGGAGGHSDYIINDVKYENKGEGGRVMGQEALFSSDGYRDACDRCASRYHAPSFDKALRKAYAVGEAHKEVVRILRGIYPDAPTELYSECADVYMKYLAEIPEAVEYQAFKKVCVRRESKYHEAEYVVREAIAYRPICTRDREKEILRFVAGLMELKIYQEHSGFDILDLCENMTGRILSYDCRNMSITDMASRMWGKVRFYASIGKDVRSRAHQIGFVY